MLRFPKSLRKRDRAVSPVIAAILLIGLAVTAGAIIVVFAIALIIGFSGGITSQLNQINVTFVSYSGTDRNSDGVIDRITVKVQNAGTNAPTIGTTTQPTGWTCQTTGTVSQGAKDIIFQTSQPMSQLATESFSISVQFTLADATPLTVSVTEASTAAQGNTNAWTPATLSEGQMLFDFQDTKMTRSTTTGSAAVVYNDDNALHTLTRGARIFGGAATVALDCYYYRHGAGVTDDGTAYAGTAGGRTLANSPETWSVATKPYLSFWMKTNIDISGAERNLYLWWETWDGTTPTYEDSVQLDTYFTATGTWTHAIIDMAAVKNADDGSTFGALCFRMLSTTAAAGNWYLYIDDVSVHDGL